MDDRPSLALRVAGTLDALTEEPLIAAIAVGIGAELAAPTTGVLAFGLAWLGWLIVSRIRRA